MAVATAPTKKDDVKGVGDDSYTGETVTAYLNRRNSALKTLASPTMKFYDDIAKFMLPRSVRFSSTEKNQESRRNKNIINNTAGYALRTGSAGMMSGITSPSRPWFNLLTSSDKLNKRQDVKVWLDEVRKLMVKVFTKSNLYTTLPAVYKELMAFGTSCFALMEDDEDTIRCYAFPLGSYVLCIGPRGNINGCIREYRQSVGQLVKEFGLENCSSTVQAAWKNRQFETEVDVIHAVEENPDADETKLESRYLPYRSVYFEKKVNTNDFLRFKGLHEMAIIAPRWEVTGEDTWGFGLGSDVLGDVSMLQTLEKRKLQSLDTLNDPPRNAPASMANEFIGRLSGETSYVPDNLAGQKVEAAYEIDPHLADMRAEIAATEQRVKHGLFEDLFLMIAEIERSNVTATEIQARQQEKMMAMGPVLERLNDEMLDLIVRRTYAIMERAGQIPTPPSDLQGQAIVIEYISIMAQAMKLQGLVGVERFVAFVGGFANTRPDALDKLNSDECIDAYGDMTGVPPALINDADTVKKIRADRADKERAAQSMAMAEQGAKTAKTLADTQVTQPSALQAMAGVLNQAGPQVGAP